MKKLWLLVLALVVINAGVIVALAGSGGDGDDLTSAVRASAEGEGEEEEEEEGGLGPASPDDYFLFQRSTRGDVPNAQDFRRSVRQARTLRREAAQARAAQNVRAARWALEGPTNIGGRLVDLVVDRTQPDSVYVAAATGGVWRSTDAGATLEQAWPDDASQSMGAIAQGADGAIWAGTGELNPGGGSITFGGTGIYVSEERRQQLAPARPREQRHDGTHRHEPHEPGRSLRRGRRLAVQRRAASAASTRRPTAAAPGIRCSPPRRRSPAAPTS